MRRLTAILLAVALAVSMIIPAVAAAQVSTRIKDVAKVQGVRDNQLVGYGLVVGLAGTGDSDKVTYTNQSLVNMLKSFGVMISASNLKPKNVAAVMVTANLPPFAKPGDAIDITVSSMGDAKNLQGGTLLQTPLRAANGQIYAVGQGAVSTGGYVAGGSGASQRKNFPTVGSVPNGAFVEKEVPMPITDQEKITLSLSQPDFTTASRISEAIDQRFGQITDARDPGTIDIVIPRYYRQNLVGFIAAIEELAIMPDNAAKVVINERTGTVVVGSNVTIDQVAVAQGGLTVKIGQTIDVSQPPPFSEGSTVITANPTVNAKEQQAGLVELPESASVGDVVTALNAVGATPRDIIAILQAIKAAGALHADLQIM
ncbi:flagellar basal body P-ring protein FlgI [Sporomusa acidovorans]|uniref:Flagellar P-ring protein n=1 Tax=Sporomusa acidovorans (strain ATCC 49682 / DSM 3132 / Mol) TaxID=1123286 RepID=A0ABZ3J759_SPOA4|nr:flagellar basal body P-ring protein FlgI [Sporomusa acidovorans]OZC19271.1 flagellar P-ring protein precursor [Sporomusa acidovorans DSM 3132]SDD82460.1 flagellar P-ring protein precursor FlgI [Sporomusa acidovorans]